MVLSNAERQKRYRQRLKAAARGDDLAERVRLALDAAFQVAWGALKRGGFGDVDDCPDWQALRDSLAGATIIELRETFDHLEDHANSEREIAALRTALAVIDAVLLRHGQSPKQSKKRGKRGG